LPITDSAIHFCAVTWKVIWAYCRLSFMSQLPADLN